MLEIIKMPYEPDPGIKMKLCYRTGIVIRCREVEWSEPYSAFSWIAYIAGCGMYDPYPKTCEYIYSKSPVSNNGSHLDRKCCYGAF